MIGDSRNRNTNRQPSRASIESKFRSLLRRSIKPAITGRRSDRLSKKARIAPVMVLRVAMPNPNETPYTTPLPMPIKDAGTTPLIAIRIWIKIKATTPLAPRS